MDGCSVRLWVDRWLPTISLGHPNPESVSVTRDTRVASLLSPTTHSWDISLLQLFLSVEEQTTILATPIEDPLTNDRLVWSSTKTGLYVIKSGYHCARSLHTSSLDLYLSLSRSLSRQVWRLIWKLQTPPKLRNFMR